MATKINLNMDQGADFLSVFTMQYPNTLFVDLSIFSGASQMRKNYTSSNNIPFIVNLYANGTLQLAMNANTTSNIIPGRYLYDVELTGPTNIITRVLEGIVDVEENITR
jgi:hypothetical protein